MENLVANETETEITAENIGGDPKGDAGKSADTVSTSAKSEQTEKTFSQAEVESIVKSRLDRAKKDMPDREQLKAFKEWQNSQKTAEQLTAEKIAAAENAKAEAEEKAAKLEAKVTALSKGVKADAVDDVISLALAKVNEEVDIGAAIEGIIKKYPSFINGGQDKPSTTGKKTTGKLAEEEQTYLDRKYKNNPYYKK